MPENLFTQQVTYKDADIDLSVLQSMTLTFKLNSLAPNLVLQFNNPNNAFLEEVGIKKFETIQARFMDLYSEDPGRLLNFVIVGTPPDRNKKLITLECVEENAYRLTEKGSKIFNNKDVGSILKSLVHPLKVDIGNFPANNTYHLSNERKFALVARIAREMGAVFHISDGSLVFKTKKELFDQEDLTVFEYQNKMAPFRIVQPRLLDHDYELEDRKRHYLGWDIEKGLIQSSQNSESPKKMVSCRETAKLNNLNTLLKPVMRFGSLGHGMLKVGIPIKLFWHTGLPHRPLDESYPDRVLFGEIKFHEERDFSCAITGVV